MVNPTINSIMRSLWCHIRYILCHTQAADAPVVRKLSVENSLPKEFCVEHITSELVQCILGLASVFQPEGPVSILSGLYCGWWMRETFSKEKRLEEFRSRTFLSQGDANDHKLVEFSRSSTVLYCRRRTRGWKRKEETLLKTLEIKGNSNNILKD